MRDLTAVSGLPLHLDDTTGLLAAGDGLVLPAPGVRRLGDLRGVLADPYAAATADDRPAYYLYRDVHLAGDDTLLARHGLRYDVTVTLPDRYGGEFAKTAGHYHSTAPDGAGYPEIYEVLQGHAAFLLQWVANPAAAHPAVLAVWIAQCDPGDKIVIPPDCGHVTINTGDEPLVVSDLVAVAAANDYGSFRSARGAAYYLTGDPTGTFLFQVQPNPRYGIVPAPVLRRGARWSPLLPDTDPVYQHVKDAPAAFGFLTEPAVKAAAMRALWLAGSLGQ